MAYNHTFAAGQRRDVRGAAAGNRARSGARRREFVQRLVPQNLSDLRRE